jgi:AcrR family transcriptional regulator
MARTRSPDFELRQQSILRSAAELFAARGYSETLLEDIAEHCGIKRSSIYHYHASKHSLLHSLITWKIGELARKVEAAVNSVQGPHQKLEALVDALVKDYVASPHEVKILNTQTHHLDEEALKSTAQLQDRIINHAREAILRLRPDIQLAPQYNTAMAMLLFGMVNWIHVWYKPTGDITQDQLVQLIVRQFVAGLEHQVPIWQTSMR